MIRPLPFGESEYLDSVAIDAIRSHGINPCIVDSDEAIKLLSTSDGLTVTIIVVQGLSSDGLDKCLKRCLELRLPSVALIEARHVEYMANIPNLNDFLVYPLDIMELIARCKKIINSIMLSKIEGAIVLGGLVINPENYEVSIHGNRINLRFKEYELLLLLATSPGRVYTREAILNHVWGYDYFGGTRTVDVHIRRLRSKIDSHSEKFIETVWNLGYRFKDLYTRTE
jgi:DNA-binding response OmpR family regulator